ncbi:antitoxin AF2212-like protein [Thermococcus stetteri]|uniref:antitoxin AF2212-like protein n=1 Tax=Thermococcus stetteri TaxID=49900 RepID=UPI001AE10D22|nr:antitoxin AF2212-like protein [Thermococcus stetteri]MBP1912415.1 putative DNA-binding antitoxin AbrB/MazE fold protein [Thermococcus stetteri]
MGENVEVVEAVYENGVLKPLKPLKLKEGERVLLKVKKSSIIELARKLREKITPETVDMDPTDYLLKMREERDYAGRY